MLIFGKAIRLLGNCLVPSLTSYLRRQRRIRHNAERLQHTLSTTTSLVEQVWFAIECTSLSNQQPGELLQLLNLIRQSPPTVLCEIGTDRGGTLALFASVASPDARILSIDLKYSNSAPKALRHLIRPKQRLTCLEADSHAQATLRRVRRWLRGRQFDFLFIDGDHSYEGVKRDYEMYGPLVRNGGIISFHDIVPDYRTRFGVQTKKKTGNVPRYWKDLSRKLNGQTAEFIENPEQDGYGIGVVRVGEHQ